MPVGPGGEVDLRAIYNADDVAAYALTIVYSTTKQDIALLIGTDDAARIWQNGRLLLDSPQFAAAGHYVISATIEPGRNLFVAKVLNFKGPHGFHMLISEEPADFVRGYVYSKKWEQAAEAYKKAIALEHGNGDLLVHEAGGQAFFELGRWQEAALALERVVALDPGSWNRQFLLSDCYLAVSNFTACRRLCEAAIKQHGKTHEAYLINNLVWQAALIPDAVRDYSKVLEMGSKLADKKDSGGNSYNTYGAILYRARRYNAALTFLQKSIDAKKGTGNAFDWVFTAMARYKSKHPGAKEALEKANATAKDWTGPNAVEIRALIREAEAELMLPPPP